MFDIAEMTGTGSDEDDVDGEDTVDRALLDSNSNFFGSSENPPKSHSSSAQTESDKNLGNDIISSGESSNNVESCTDLQRSSAASDTNTTGSVDKVNNNSAMSVPPAESDNGDKAAVAFSLGIYQPRNGRVPVRQQVVPRDVSTDRDKSSSLVGEGSTTSAKGPRALRRQHGKRYDKVQ
jgi:hypothetical protein